MGANASQGGRRSSLSRGDLWYYDRLPPTARQALANAAFSWSSGYYYNLWNKAKPGFKTGADIAKRVVIADQSVKRKPK